MSTNLAQQHCEACHGGTPTLSQEAIDQYQGQLTYNWEVREGRKLRYPFKLSDFRATMTFANEVARVAEEEGHHPTMTIKPGQCTVVLTTHAIGGLSANDFIMAAKVEHLPKG